MSDYEEIIDGCKSQSRALEKEMVRLDESLEAYCLLKENVEDGIVATEEEIAKVEHFITVLTSSSAGLSFFGKLRLYEAFNKVANTAVIGTLLGLGLFPVLGGSMVVILVLLAISLHLGISLGQAYLVYTEDTAEIRYVVEHYTEADLDKWLNNLCKKLDELKLKLGNVDGTINGLQVEKIEVQKQLEQVQCKQYKAEKKSFGEPKVEPMMRIRERNE